jgi:CheY-like chemotaxis protein
MTRILVIEDNPANMQLMAYLLKAFGYTPLEAIDGETGLLEVQRLVPELVLCDLQLPGIDGYEVLRQIKATPDLAAIPVVAVTAYAMVGDRDRVLAAGFNGYIAKPITPETFIGQMEVFLPPGRRSGPPKSTDPAC